MQPCLHDVGIILESIIWLTQCCNLRVLKRELIRSGQALGQNTLKKHVLRVRSMLCSNCHMNTIYRHFMLCITFDHLQPTKPPWAHPQCVSSQVAMHRHDHYREPGTTFCYAQSSIIYRSAMQIKMKKAVIRTHVKIHSPRSTWLASSLAGIKRAR